MEPITRFSTFGANRIGCDRFQRQVAKRSFTLVELLTVVAIMGILAIGAVSSFRYLSERDLVNAATVIEGLVDQGRSEAISRGTVVELCLVTGTAAPGTMPYRALSLWALDPTSGNYQQISKWEHLPDSVQVASVASPYTTYGLTDTNALGVHITDTVTLNPNSTTATFNGQSLTVNYLKFLPSGGLQPPANVGSTNVNVFVLKSSSVSKPPPLKDWREIQINTLVGQSKIMAP